MADRFLVRATLILGGVWLKGANITATYFMQFQIPDTYLARLGLWSAFVCGALASTGLLILGLFPDGFTRRREEDKHA